MGCSLVTASLALAGAAVGLVPLIIYGLDLFTAFPLVFLLRYTGIAIISKTFYGQSLDTYLSFPEISYALVLGLLTTVSFTAAIMRGAGQKMSGAIAEPKDPETLRIVGTLAAVVGFIGALGDGIFQTRIEGLSSTGALTQVSFLLAQVYLLSVPCETIYLIKASGGKRVFSWRIVIYLVGTLIYSGLIDKRQPVGDFLITYALTILLQKALRLRHVAVGLGCAFVFSTIVSPVLLGIRSTKHQDVATYVPAAVSSAGQALTDPTYMQTMKATELIAARKFSRFKEWDYYGAEHPVTNRLSWIGLVDEVYSHSHKSAKLGGEVLPAIFGKIEPRWLFPDKPIANYAFGDWLAWHFGMEEEGGFGALNFGLPMEGLVTIGLVGWFLYPAVVLSCFLGICSAITDMSRRTAFAIFLFSANEFSIFEAQSDSFVLLFLRDIPLITAIYIAFIYAAKNVRAVGTASRGRVPLRRAHSYKSLQNLKSRAAFTASLRKPQVDETSL